MNGTCTKTGKTLSGLEHLKQSIRDILTTPLGSRVRRRDYGSELPRLVDAPMNAETILRFYAATAEALMKWEPRFKLNNCKINKSGTNGQLCIDLYGTYLPNGQPIKIEGILVI